jgi:hypothetical protein
MSYGKSTWQEHGATFWKEPANQSINSFLTHALVAGNRVTVPWYDGTQGTANVLTWIATAGLIGLFCLLGLKTWKDRSAGFPLRDQALFHSTTCLMLLVPSLMWDHYLVMLLPAACWLLTLSIEFRRFAPGFAAAAGWMVIAWPWKPDAAAYRVDAGLLLMSLKLWPALVLFGLTTMAAVGAPAKSQLGAEILQRGEAAGP